MRANITLSLAFNFIVLMFRAQQSPCSGTPSANGMLPASSFTLCSGSTTTLGLSNTYSTSGITYSWSSSSTSTVGPWSPVNGANARDLLTPPLLDTIYYMITITCTNSGQSITIPVTILVVPCYTPCSGAPSNTVVPASQTLCAGSSVTLNFVQTYSLTIGNSFQWQSSGSSSGPYSALSGATGSVYSAATPSATTYYQAVVTCSNGGQSYTTAPVAVNVITCTSCFGAPGSNTVVGPSTVCAGSSATLSLAQTYSSTGITYLWQSSTVSQVGPFSPGFTTTTATYVTPTLGTTTFFNVVITCTNSNQSFSTVHTVSAVACPTACVGYPAGSSILPTNQTLCAGAAASMSLSNSYQYVTGLTFQWNQSSSSSGPFVPTSPAGTGTTYSTGPLNSTTYYQAVITCTNVSAGFTTAVYPVTVVTCTNCFGTPGANTIVPASPTICSGSSATLGLVNTYTSGGITYLWQSSNVSIVGPYNPISGATSSVYTTPNLTTTTYYQVIITCTASGQSTNLATQVTVVQCNSVCSGAPASNTILPLNHTVCIGEPATMSLAATYTAPGITYAWHTGTSNIGPFVPVAGATLATYTHTFITVDMYFQVVITCTASGQFISMVHTVIANPCVNRLPGQHGELLANVYPIPARDELIIESEQVHGGHFILEDLTGRTVSSGSLSPGRTVTSVRHLEAGIYLLRLQADGRVKVARIVKE
jgi:hypothetical protein